MIITIPLNFSISETQIVILIWLSSTRVPHRSRRPHSQPVSKTKPVCERSLIATLFDDDDDDDYDGDGQPVRTQAGPAAAASRELLPRRVKYLSNVLALKWLQLSSVIASDVDTYPCVLCNQPQWTPRNQCNYKQQRLGCRSAWAGWRPTLLLVAVVFQYARNDFNLPIDRAMRCACVRQWCQSWGMIHKLISLLALYLSQ